MANIEDIKKAEKSLTRAEDGREDMQLVTASHLNCQSMLTTAPMTVAVLGHLTLVTIHNDVDLRREGKNYEHIKYPESLRASVVNLANEGSQAFMTAEKNMDQIRIYTGQVPNHVKSAVKILLQGTKHEIAKVLPNYLQLLDNTASKCVEKSMEVEQAFQKVELLAEELQEACALTQGKQEHNIKKAEEKIKKIGLEQEAAKQREERMAQEREEMKKRIEEARRKYEQEMKNLPGAGKLIGMGLADGLCKLVSAPGNLVQGIGGLLSGGNKKKDSSSGSGLETALGFINNATKQLQSFVEEGTGSPEEINRFKTSFESELSSLASKDGPETEKLSNLFKTAINVTAALSDPEQRTDRSKMKSEVDKLQGMAQTVELFSQTLHGGMPMSGKAPKMSKEESTGPLDAYVKQAYFKVESAEAALREAQEKFGDMSQRMEKNKDHSLKLMTDLASVNLSQVDFKEIQILMRRCLDALADIRIQWAKLVRFFSYLSNLIKSAMNDSFRLFTATLETEKDPSLTYGFSDVLIDVIYQQATEANKIAFLTSDISGMYLDISEKHLTDPLAQIGKLLALDPQKDEKLIEKKQKKLTDDCTAATEAVGKFITQKKEEFDEKITRRLERIDTEMRAVLPPRPEEDPHITQMKKEAIDEARLLKKKQEEEDMDQFC